MKQKPQGTRKSKEQQETEKKKEKFELFEQFFFCTAGKYSSANLKPLSLAFI